MSDAGKKYMDRLQELMQRKEPLLPELKRYVCKTSFGTAIKHPLLIEMFYTPAMNAIYNERYQAKLKYATEKLDGGNHSGWLWMYERPYRIQMFIEIMDRLKDEEYWDILGSIWSDSENLWQYGNSTLGWLLGSPRPGREKMMDDKEREFFANLPETFTIYRGHQGRNRLGYSWSLSYFKARWFAERWLDYGGVKRHGVLQATVKKEQVNAVLLGRNEFEIVTSPHGLENVRAVRKTSRPDWAQTALNKSWAGFKLSKKGSYHGLWHWEKVERNALALAKNTPDADPVVARLFALLHDSKRENEDHDPQHGHRAADWIKKLDLPIDSQQREKLMEACRFHNDGKVSDDPTIGVCWDADRLDLTRVGIIPDPAFLSTEAGKTMIWSV